MMNWWRPEYVEAIRVTLVISTIWAALFAYVWTWCRVALERKPTRSARFLWTVGCFFFVLHVLGAYEAFYGWSHETALEMTRLQTVAMTGIDTSFGLYLNFLFGIIWVVDTAWWWWRGDDAYRQRGRGLFLAEHVFLLFMMVNGAFIFVVDWLRWLGLALCIVGSIAVLASAIRMKRQAVRSPSS